MTSPLPEPIDADLRRYVSQAVGDVASLRFESQEGGIRISSQAEPTKAAFAPLPIALSTLGAQVKAMLARKQQSLMALSHEWRFDALKRAIVHRENAQQHALTDKETALLQSLLAAAPNAISRAQLLEDVWRYDEQVDTRTLETHIYRLRQKLEAAGLATCVRTQEDGYAWLVKAA